MLHRHPPCPPSRGELRRSSSEHPLKGGIAPFRVRVRVRLKGGTDPFRVRTDIRYPWIFSMVSISDFNGAAL